jgi:hypothetical protein
MTQPIRYAIVPARPEAHLLYRVHLHGRGSERYRRFPAENVDKS